MNVKMFKKINLISTKVFFVKWIIKSLQYHFWCDLFCPYDNQPAAAQFKSYHKALESIND